jgi:hypothetical protein
MTIPALANSAATHVTLLHAGVLHGQQKYFYALCMQLSKGHALLDPPCSGVF